VEKADLSCSSCSGGVLPNTSFRTFLGQFLGVADLILILTEKFNGNIRFNAFLKALDSECLFFCGILNLINQHFY
jgi:hypothetical protein